MPLRHISNHANPFHFKLYNWVHGIKTIDKIRPTRTRIKKVNESRIFLKNIFIFFSEKKTCDSMVFLSQDVNQPRNGFYHIDGTNLDWFIHLTGGSAGAASQSGKR